MNDSQLTEFLLRQTAGLTAEAAVTRLVETHAVSRRRCEQQAIRTEVDRLVRRGAGRCEAMETAALGFHCSYAKVRQAVYYKPQK